MQTKSAAPPPAATPQQDHDAAKTLLDRLRKNVTSVYLGKHEAVKMALVTLLADGHLLLEDVPGVGKTLLAKAIARSLRCSFHRIQFTPDLLPSDLLGTSVYHQQSGEFVFKEGPVFANIILADEINRATPRTQSALLEAMSERTVSADGETRQLGPPFLVLATQNPYEFEGTYPLPESQLDRFLMRLHVGYPDRAAEKEILSHHRAGEPVEKLQPVLDASNVTALQQIVRNIKVDDAINDYILSLIEATRVHPALHLGASTRAALALYRAVQSLATVEGRKFVVPDDVKRLAKPVLAHRLLAKSFRQGDRGDSAEHIVSEILETVPVPT